MTLKQAKELEPGIYEITFAKGQKSLGAIGNDDKGKPWFAAASWTGSTITQWDEVKSICRVIPSRGYLPR